MSSFLFALTWANAVVAQQPTLPEEAVVALTGDWSGEIVVDRTRSQEVVWHFERARSGGLRGLMGPAAMGRATIPMERIASDGRELSFTVDAQNGEFFGTMSGGRATGPYGLVLALWEGRRTSDGPPVSYFRFALGDSGELIGLAGDSPETVTTALRNVALVGSEMSFQAPTPAPTVRAFTAEISGGTAAGTWFQGVEASMTMSRTGRLGAAVSFLIDGETVVDLWGGHLDANRSREWRRDTLAAVFSTTKGVTALCAHHLADRGRLDLDAPVSEYWPAFAAAGKERIPVRWLLSHQAGLPAIREPLPEGALYDWKRMCEALAAQEPWWTPGTRHGYHVTTFGYHERTSDMHGSLSPAAPPPGAGDSLGGAEASEAMEMLRLVFTNPPQKPDFVNTREWRRAEIPSVNGHGTARSLARMYGALARGGEIDGVRLFGQSALDRATEEAVFGPDAVLFGRPTRYGLGFTLRHDGMP